MVSVMELKAFVLSQLPPPPCRVLEVGCGEGELALALADEGYDVRAIDPDAPAGSIFRRTTIEEFDDPGPFDAVVASRSLHHVHDLGAALDKLVRMLNGPLILNEFAWDRLEPMTPEWAKEHDGLHGYDAMRAELDARFEERFFEWRPYPADGQDVPGLGFRYVGVMRP
jgi:ubiquinone/menaquinone biosynthesis C-methylase UbiE